MQMTSPVHCLLSHQVLLLHSPSTENASQPNQKKILESQPYEVPSNVRFRPFCPSSVTTTKVMSPCLNTESATTSKPLAIWKKPPCNTSKPGSSFYKKFSIAFLLTLFVFASYPSLKMFYMWAMYIQVSNSLNRSKIPKTKLNLTNGGSFLGPY